MRFYLDNEEIEIVNGITLNETLDESLDTCSLTLLLKGTDTAIKPKTSFIIEDKNGVKKYFIVEKDTVEVASKTPLLFKHELDLIESVAILKSYQLRNSVFTQPAKNEKFGYATYREGHSNKNTIVLNSNEKVKRAFIHFYAYKKTVVENNILTTATYSLDYDTRKKTITYTINGNEYSTTITNNDIVEIDTSIFETGKDITFSVAGTSESDIFSIKFEIETYYYTILDIVKEIVRRCELELAYSSDLDFLNELIAPDYSFTQNDLYSALVNIFSYVDALPTLNGNELGIEFLNDKNETKIEEVNITSYKNTLDSDRYVNSLMTDYKNATTPKAVFYPSSMGYALPKPSVIGVPGETDWAIYTDKPIREIKSMHLMSSSTSKITAKMSRTITTTTSSQTVKEDIIINVPIDISSIVYERTNYLQLPRVDTDFGFGHKSGYQNNSFYYTKGTNEINYYQLTNNTIGQKVALIKEGIANAIQETIFQSTVDDYGSTIIIESISDIEMDLNGFLYQVEYYPTFSGRAVVESNENKFNGTERLDQSNGGTDLNRLGLNLYGQSLRLGNEEKVVSHKVLNFEDRIKKGSIYENEWLVNKASTSIFKDFSVQTLSLTKNFNRLNKFIRLNQNKRFNEIDTSVVERSEIILKDYVYLATNAFEEESDNIYYDKNYFFSALSIALNKSNSYGLDPKECWFKTDSDYLYIPLVKYGFGNAMCFEVAFDSANSAGTQLSTNSERYGTSYFGKYCLYTDEDGFKNNVSLSFLCHRFSETELQYTSLPTVSTIENGNTLIDKYFYKIIDISNLEVNKQPNEIFALNYELIWLSYDNNVFIGNAFIQNSCFVSELEDLNKLHLYCSDKLYSVIDHKALGEDYGEITFTFPNNKSILVREKCPTSCKSWAIANSKGDIYFAVNQDLKSGDDLRIYILFKSKRL